MFDYFRNSLRRAHEVCCEGSPTKGLYDNCQYGDLDLHSRSQVHLKCDYFLIRHISYNSYAITFTLGMTVDVWMPYTIMLDSTGSAKAKVNQRCMLSLGN